MFRTTALRAARPAQARFYSTPPSEAAKKNNNNMLIIGAAVAVVGGLYYLTQDPKTQEEVAKTKKQVQ